MANTKKKKNKTETDPVLLEKKARTDLESGRYRKAKDGFKELYALNKEKYLTPLLDCYKGMVRQMVENGQTEEAKIVLEHIKTLVPNFDADSLSTQIKIKKSDNDTAVIEYINCIVQKKNDLRKEEFVKAADLMVTAFCDFPVLEAERPELNNELCAVKKAMEQISEEKFDDALESVRNIKRISIFAHWKLFIKGIAAFYTKDDTKCRASFKMLPANSVPYSAAQSFLFIMDWNMFQNIEKGYNTISRNACKLTGLDKYAVTIPKAEYLWKKGRYKESYTHISSNHSGFASGVEILNANLATFFYNSVFNIPESFADGYFDTLGAIHEYDNNSHKALLFSRIVANFLEEDAPDDDLVGWWMTFLENYRKVHGQNNKLNALVFAHLGKMFSVIEEPDELSFLYTDKEVGVIRNKELAIKYLEKSIMHNGSDKDVYLSLLKVYELTKDKSKLNKLMDTMIKQFPEDKEVLVNTGEACIKRKVFFKGVKYLEKALSLDSLDSNTKKLLIIGYLNQSISNYKKGKSAAGSETLVKAINLGLPSSLDFSVGHPFIYARWAALEFAFGDKEKGDELLARALTINHADFPVKYFILLMFKTFGVSISFFRNLENEISKAFNCNQTSGNALHACKVISHVEGMGKFPWINKEKCRVDSYLMSAAENKDDNYDIKTIMELIMMDFPKKDNESDYESFGVALSYIKKMLNIDRNDPQFLFLGFTLRSYTYGFIPSRKAVDCARKILALAEKREEIELIKRVRALGDLMEGFINSDRFDCIYGSDENYSEKKNRNRDAFELLNEISDFSLAPEAGRKKKRRYVQTYFRNDL